MQGAWQLAGAPLSLVAAEIAGAFRLACGLVLDAPLLGNAHSHGEHRKSDVEDARKAAILCAEALAATGLSVGARVLHAAEQMRMAANRHDNFGVLLLCAPLAIAAETARDDLPEALWRALPRFGSDDAHALHLAREAMPGARNAATWLGEIEPETTLMEIMAGAAGHDRVARNYVQGFGDVFDLGLSALNSAASRGLGEPWTTLGVFLTFLAAFPDTAIEDRNSRAAAQEIWHDAMFMRAEFDRDLDPARLMPELMSWDQLLKARGVRPAASSQLTVATLFAARLQAGLHGIR